MTPEPTEHTHEQPVIKELQPTKQLTLQSDELLRRPDPSHIEDTSPLIQAENKQQVDEVAGGVSFDSPNCSYNDEAQMTQSPRNAENSLTVKPLESN